jgi:hypothetical protein
VRGRRAGRDEWREGAEAGSREGLEGGREVGASPAGGAVGLTGSEALKVCEAKNDRA